MATQVKEILLSGLSSSPTDYMCEDGNLSSAINMLHENGALVEASNHQPKVIGDVRNVDEFLYQHSNDGYHHIIAKVDRKLHWYLLEDNSLKNEQGINYDFFDEDVNVKNITSVGNTLIVYGEDKAYYFLYKNGNYNFIGNRIPDLEIAFGLTPVPYYYTYDRPSISDDGITSTTDYGNLKVHLEGIYASIKNRTRTDNEDYQLPCVKTKGATEIANLTDSAIGLANQFVSEWCGNKGYFSQPFIVRCAYRMYDQSTIMCTAPVLLRPTTFANPIIPINRIEEDYLQLGCIGIGCKLEYYIKNSKEELDKWSDIISGIEIFASAPIYTYNQGGKVDSFVAPYIGDNSFDQIPTQIAVTKLWSTHNSICKVGTDENDSVNAQWDVYKGVWSKTELGISQSAENIHANADGSILYDKDNKIIAKALGSKNWVLGFGYESKGATTLAVENILPTAYMLLPKFSEENIKTKVRDCANFYRIKSYSMSELQFDGTRTEVKIEEGLLNSLVNCEQMKDEYRSHDTFIPNSVAPYNNRLNIANLTRYPYNGYSPFNSFQRIYDTSKSATISTIVYLRNSNGDIVVKRGDVSGSNFGGAINTETRKGYINYAFYPDSTAYKMDIVARVGGISNILVASLDLAIHSGLNGAVYFNGLSEEIQFVEKDYFTSDDYFNALLAQYGNRKSTIESGLIYTSDVNNPFLFSAENVEQIGNGEIIAIVPAAQALSNGQFGQFPMYAFTTDGIWALSVSENGGWSSKQPISRDVAISENTILQLDQTVIFATDRGLMEISGSNVSCISDLFNGNENEFAETYKEHLSHMFSEFSTLDFSIDMVTPFRRFIADKDTHMHYDYRHQKIIISNSNKDVCFVYNMIDKLWTMEVLKIGKAINSYPNALATTGTKLIDFSVDEDGTSRVIPYGGFILTRPLKLDAPDIMKTIRTIMVRGNFRRQRVQLFLYGSRDMDKWLYIGGGENGRLSLRHGTPFKYFRVAISTDLSKEESITGLSVEYEVKETNKLR